MTFKSKLDAGMMAPRQQHNPTSEGASHRDAREKQLSAARGLPPAGAAGCSTLRRAGREKQLFSMVSRSQASHRDAGWPAQDARSVTPDSWRGSAASKRGVHSIFGVPRHDGHTGCSADNSEVETKGKSAE